jgi:hypothetical protein
MADGGAPGSASGAAGSGVGGRPIFDRDHVPCQGASDCPMGATCDAGHCSCPVALPDACSGRPADPAAEVQDWVCTSLRIDSSNCGACGVVCEDGAACALGQCSPSAQMVSAVMGCSGKFQDSASVRLVGLDEQLFWTDSEAGTVQAIGLADGKDAVVAAAQTNPQWLAADAAGVYWTKASGVADVGPAIMKHVLPVRESDAPVQLITFPAGSQIEGLAVQDGVLYSAVGHGVYALSTNEKEPGNTMVGTASGLPRGLAVNKTRVIWTTEERGAIGSDDLAPGASAYRELALGQNSVLWPDIAARGAYAYWANGQTLMRSSLAGDQTPEQVTSTGSTITALVLSEDNAYFAEESGRISRHPLLPDEEPATVLALAQPEVTALALGGGMIYWESECEIRRVAF